MSNAIALNKGDDDRGHYISVQSAFMDISKLKHKKELISNDYQTCSSHGRTKQISL